MSAEHGLCWRLDWILSIAAPPRPTMGMAPHFLRRITLRLAPRQIVAVDEAAMDTAGHKFSRGENQYG
jgi:hypothetical protein